MIAIATNGGRTYTPAITPATGGARTGNDPNILVELECLASGKCEGKHHFVRFRADALFDGEVGDCRYS